MKQTILGIALLSSWTIGLIGCATCCGLAQKKPHLPQNEVYIQLKAKQPHDFAQVL